ncbi:hypothetical protein RJ639_019209 [Escallonia herrerae]|uniref:Uncharacterized protein n=1 Tax=Escallonia herrerae TaxID=1293975 RepID=A0AA89AHH1_9ASTE|nr:hypothetical protein RJ639_019209 [Escallonia herrerae]
MALTHLCTFPKLFPESNISKEAHNGGRFPRFVHAKAVFPACVQTGARRLASYHPPMWDHDYVESLTSSFVGDNYTRRADTLKRDIRRMLDQVEEPLNKFQLIDTLHRLGISYHFEVEIKRNLERIHSNTNKSDRWNKEADLYAIALEFRLYRQHGFDVPQDVFNCFKDEARNFKLCLCEDTRGMLYLYEASYLSVRGEDLLDEARHFTAKHLTESLKDQKMDQNLATFVSHALELPLHWRMPRLEARWFIDVYERTQDINTTLLELAKLDFNMVQVTHQEDLKRTSRWWKGTGLGEKLSFARDMLMENFFWTVGINFEPQLQYTRKMTTRLISLITVIDDIYDAYGTLEELELFTNAVERWDINELDRLPDFMKICFFALYNFTNEMAYDALKEQDSCIISYLKNAWADLCRAYLLEETWYHKGYTPAFEEYIENASISVGAPLTLVHAYISFANPMTKEALDCLEKHSDIVRWSSMIVRLSNDLVTSQDQLKIGDSPKSTQCYMKETSCSEADARKYIKHLIGEAWKKINEGRLSDSPFSGTFIDTAINLARTAQCMYQLGDDRGIDDDVTKDRVLSLLQPGYTPAFEEYIENASISVGAPLTWDVNEMWTDLCKSYLLEAKWYNSGYIPTLTRAYFFANNPTTEEALTYLEKYPNIIRWSSMILRLSDDLGTSKDELQRGDDPKSIQCYMHETGASEEDAGEHIRHLISETWKKMNEDRVASSLFNQTFIGAAINLARMALNECVSMEMVMVSKTGKLKNVYYHYSSIPSLLVQRMCRFGSSGRHAAHL